MTSLGRIDIPKMHTISRVIQENPTMVTLVFDCNFDVRPGQFVNMWIPRLDEKPFSVAWADGKELHLTIADVGPFSHEAVQLQVGGKAGLRGPYGKGFTWISGQKIAMVGGGFGSAPLYFTAVQAIKDGCKVDMIIGARREDLLIYVDRFNDLEGATLHIATDDGSVGHKGYNVQILEKLVKEKKFDLFLTCGPEVMMKAVTKLAHQENIDAQISIERYMKCGFGLCGNCVVDNTGDRICTKGPVVPLKYVDQVAEFGEYHRDDLGKKHYW
jgi:dihydroorotate dehydrogenase electron transfer subunit